MGNRMHLFMTTPLNAGDARLREITDKCIRRDSFSKGRIQ
jgi:hypothetical protein